MILQSHLEETYELSYFDSLIAASTLTLDGNVISDDKDFDRVEEITRTPLSKNKRA